MSLDYNAILERLETIEQDLADRQPDYERAAREFHKLTRDYELRVARVSLTSKATTATEKKWNALDQVAAAADDLFSNLRDAEGTYEGCKAAIRVLEQRASIGQSLLRQAAQERGG